MRATHPAFREATKTIQQRRNVLLHLQLGSSVPLWSQHCWIGYLAFPSSPFLDNVLLDRGVEIKVPFRHASIFESTPENQLIKATLHVAEFGLAILPGFITSLSSLPSPTYLLNHRVLPELHLALGTGSTTKPRPQSWLIPLIQGLTSRRVSIK